MKRFSLLVIGITLLVLGACAGMQGFGGGSGVGGVLTTQGGGPVMPESLQAPYDQATADLQAARDKLAQDQKTAATRPVDSGLSKNVTDDEAQVKSRQSVVTGLEKAAAAFNRVPVGGDTASTLGGVLTAFGAFVPPPYNLIPIGLGGLITAWGLGQKKQKQQAQDATVQAEADHAATGAAVSAMIDDKTITVTPGTAAKIDLWLPSHPVADALSDKIAKAGGDPLIAPPATPAK